VEAIDALAPSWVLGAHGVALLHAWCEGEVHEWIAASKATLRAWKARQAAGLASIGWTCLPSDANFLCGHAAGDPASGPAMAAILRSAEIRLRDCGSFGLPGHFRLSVQAPEAQDALLAAWRAFA
jgi:histidinol-phosphate aminotransferase